MLTAFFFKKKIELHIIARMPYFPGLFFSKLKTHHK